MNSAGNNQHLTLKRYVKYALIFIVLMHFPMQYLLDTDRVILDDGLHQVFDLDQESAFGVYFSQAMFLLSGVSILLFTKIKPLLRTLAGGLLMYFSLDESISLHERFMDVFAQAGISGSGFFSFTWLIVGLPVAIGIGIFLIWLYKQLKGQLPASYFYGIGIFLTGAVIFEGIGGVLNLGEVNYSVFMVGVEETIELLGAFTIFNGVWGPEASKQKTK